MFFMISKKQFDPTGSNNELVLILILHEGSTKKKLSRDENKLNDVKLSASTWETQFQSVRRDTEWTDINHQQKEERAREHSVFHHNQ